MSALGSLAVHYVKRGIEASLDEKPSNPANPQEPEKPFPVVGFTVVFFTALLFFIVSACVSYIYGKVITTLAAVEDPNPDVYVRIDAHITAENDPEVPLPNPKPITSSLRTTTAHLRARAGRWSLFRGLALYMLLSIAIALVSSPLAALLGGGLLGHAVGRFIADIVLANVRVAWIHIVISEPSTKRLWARIPAWRKTVPKMAPAAAIRALASQITTFVPLLVAYATHIFRNNASPFDPTDASPAKVGGSFGIALLALILYVLILMPAEVTFIRVAASMLPEEDETIVPFDRSFGGKVTPEIVGGQGKIGILDAWRSFEWSSRTRFLIVVGKVFFMEMVIGSVFGIVLVSQALFFFRDLMQSAGSIDGAMTVGGMGVSTQ
jgi:hypothetical protein